MRQKEPCCIFLPCRHVSVENTQMKTTPHKVCVSDYFSHRIVPGKMINAFAWQRYFYVLQI